MRDSLQIGKNQYLEPKEILRQKDGASLQAAEFLVRWSYVSQNTSSSNHSDSSSNADSKHEKSILIWMTREEVEVCCSNLFGSGFSVLSASPVVSDKDDKHTTDTDSEDFEDMRDDVQKLVTRARRQLNADSAEHKPIKNISYTLKVLSTYASLSSLASVFRQTGALDLILELLWSNDVETRRHAGKMLRALASHDGGSRAYVLLSLIQDKPGQTTSNNTDADFENRNTVMEMFAETSSGEEAHAVALDFMQLPQIPGKSLFKLMKCYLKVTSLLDMDSQIGQLITGDKGVPDSKPNSALFGNRKFEVTMAIADLIFELCEVMGWNNKQSPEDSIEIDAKSNEKAPEKNMKKAVMEKYSKEFAHFMGAMFSHRNAKEDDEEISDSHSLPEQLLGSRELEKELLSFTKRMVLATKKEDEASSSSQTQSRVNDDKPDKERRRRDIEDGDASSSSDDKVPAKVTLDSKTSHCIFSSKQKEGLDTVLLSELIRNDLSATKSRPIFRDCASFPSVAEYEEYVRSMLRQGWVVKATDNVKDKIHVGAEGFFLKFSSSDWDDDDPAANYCEVSWSSLGEVDRIQLRHIQIVSKGKESQKNTSNKDANKDVPDHLKTPENTKLWPNLIGQDVNKITGHPYASGIQPMLDAKKELNDVSERPKILTERQWCEVLFFIQKMEQKTQSEAFKEIKKQMEDSAPDQLEDIEEHDLTITHFKDCSIDVVQATSIIRHIAEIDTDAEDIFEKSNFCSQFLKPKSQKNRKNDFDKKTVTQSTDEVVVNTSKSEADNDVQSTSGTDEKDAIKNSELKYDDYHAEAMFRSTALLRDISEMGTGAEDIFCSQFLKPMSQKNRKNDFDKKTVTQSTDEVVVNASKSEADNDVQSTSGTDEKDAIKNSELKFDKYLAEAMFKSSDKPINSQVYLMFICRQSTPFLDSFFYSKLAQIFDDHDMDLSLDKKVVDVLEGFSGAKVRDPVQTLIFLHTLLKKELKKTLDDATLNTILLKLQPIPQEDNMYLCIAWMECIRIILMAAQHHGSSKMRGVEVIVATSGCLVGLLRILQWFPNCIESKMKAIKCLSLTMRASDSLKNDQNPNNGLGKPEAVIIRTVVNSVVSVTGSTFKPEKSELTAFFDCLHSIIKSIEEIIEKRSDTTDVINWTDTESCSEVGALYEGLCICSFLITDHEELMRRTHSMIKLILKRLIPLASSGSDVLRVVNILRTQIEKFSPSTMDEFPALPSSKSTPDISEEADSSHNIESLIEDVLDETKSQNLGLLLTSLQTIFHSDKVEQLTTSITRIVNTVFPTVILPAMNQRMSAEELSQSIDLIEHILFVFNNTNSTSTSVLCTILEEKHRPTVISTLLQLVESLSASTLRTSLESTGSMKIKEVITKTVALLQRIADADRDSAVVMCGSDAKQFLAKAIEKHDSIPKASELIEFLSGYDKYRALHSKLLVVVLSGTIGVALRCMEDARRMQESLKIPLLDRLFESLCQGSDFDVKEDKCWEKIEVSSNHRQVGKLTDGNSSTYWESNGSSGSHWVNIHMKKGVVIRKLTVHISQEDSSYMPARFVVMGGTRASDVSHQLNVLSVSTTDTKIVVLDNERKYWPIIRICVRRCQQGGIDTRIRGLEVVGPKPSFWPVLRQQLCVRTCLAYFVRARAWIASCNMKNDTKQSQNQEEKLMHHGILNLSSKIIQSIRHEQEFADFFLPNDESALVLGQAFRNAVINPLVSAVLIAGVDGSEETEKIITDSKKKPTSLMSQLLSLYLTKSNATDDNRFDAERIQFLSRLRCLTRLLVDLNPSTGSSRKGPAGLSNNKDWQQKIQSKSAKDDDSARTARSKINSPPSLHSFLHAHVGSSKAATKEADEICVDELLNVTPGVRSWSPGLGPLAKEYCVVVTERMLKFLNDTLTLEVWDNMDMDAATKEGEQFCRALAAEHMRIRKCTTQLFGTSVQFLLELVKGVAAAIGSLDVKRTVAFGTFVALTIHKILMKSIMFKISREDMNLLKELREVLFLSSGLDWGCVFEPIYCELLTLRLLYYNAYSFDLEKLVADSLSACFPDGRPNLILQDAKHSKVLWKGFVSHRTEIFDAMEMMSISDQIDNEKKLLLQRYMQESCSKLNLYENGALNVQVVSPISWRLRATRKDAVTLLLEKLDSDLLSFLKDYETYFASAYKRATSPRGLSNSGSLHWTGEGWAEVRDSVTGKIFKVTTAQMLLLLHFNANDVNKVDFSSWKNLFPHHWNTAIVSLTEKNIIKQKSENFIELTPPQTQDKFNDEKIVDVSADSNDSLTMFRTIKDVEQLTEKRNTIIDCAIVKCVKERSCPMDALIFNVKRKCLGEPIDKSLFNDGTDALDTNSNHFNPMTFEIRARCELLIDVGYIKRDSENPQILEYIPDPPPIRSRTSTICAERESVTESVTKTDEPKKEGISETKTLKQIAEESVAKEVLQADDDEENWETCDSSSSSVIASVPMKTGAIPKTKNKITKQVVEEMPLHPYDDLLSWHLIHGMSENPAVIILQKSCRSLSKEEVFGMIKKTIETVSEILSCDGDVIEALLLQMDWRVDDLIEHYTTNQTATLKAVGVCEKTEKEEKKAEDDLSEIGAACASTSAPSSTVNDDLCCPVCMNDLEPDKSLSLQCDHSCCFDCWKIYLTQKLDENQSANTKCPVANCDARPTLQTYEKLFKDEKEILERYKTMLVRSFVESVRSLSWCHCPVGCEMVVRKGSSWKNIGTCSSCGWETCFACTYAEAHYPASCGHMSQWLEDGGYYEGMGDDARSKHLARLIAKRCPNCQANIEKDDGCLHMKCLKCSHDFCWRCLKPWRPTHRDYYKCSAKVSKLAQAGMKFQEFNKRCQAHHKAKSFPLNILKRLKTLDATSVSLVNLTHAIRACVLLIKARKALAYCNIFSYYSVDTEKMKTMDLHSQVLENITIHLQEFLDKTLLSVADMNDSLSSMTDAVRHQIEEYFLKIGKQLRNLLTFSTQDMKVGWSMGKQGPPNDGKNSNRPGGVLLNARPAGMSDEERDDDIFGIRPRDATIEDIIGRIVGEDGNEGDDDDDADNFPTSDDTFSDDDDDDDDDDDNRTDDDSDDDAISDDTALDAYGMGDDEDLFDLMF